MKGTMKYKVKCPGCKKTEVHSDKKRQSPALYMLEMQTSIHRRLAYTHSNTY